MVYYNYDIFYEYIVLVNSKFIHKNYKFTLQK